MNRTEVPPEFVKENYERAVAQRKIFDEALLKNPSYLKQAGKIILHPGNNKDQEGRFSHDVRWVTADGARFIVQSSTIEDEERLKIVMNTPKLIHTVIIITNAKGLTGDFKYQKYAEGGVSRQEEENDGRAVSESKTVLAKLQFG